MRVFLSHSSKDKEYYVDHVANKIGVDRVIYDKLTFEDGLKSLDEINRTLKISDLFVVFLSENSIESDWVKYELFRAKELVHGDLKLKQIYPIIIDNRIKFDDSRIPEWLRENNLKLVVSSNKAVSLIIQRLRELSYEKHPRLKEKNNIFVGRNEQIDNFEMRINDFEREIPFALCASGLKSIGRKSVMLRSLIKTDTILSSYRPARIELNAHESIEDFILKIDDLGMTKSVKRNGLLVVPIEEKVEILCQQLNELKEEHERIFIEDNGCIITHERLLVNWFSKLYSNLKNMNYIVLGIASSYKLRENMYFQYENIMFLHISELNKKERGILLSKFLEFEKLNLNREEIRFFADILSGYPDQAYFAATLISEMGISRTKDNINLIVDYNTERVTKVVNEYEEKIDYMNVLSLLREYKTIGYNTLFNIVGRNNKNNDILNTFLGLGICETFGINGEYIRVNDVIYDYLIRMPLKLPKEFNERILKNLEGFINRKDADEYIGNISEYQYLIKKAILEQKIDDVKDFLIPSHFLMSMKELYDVHKKYDEVVVLADKVLENADFMDEHIKNEIRYYLCMSLARNKNKRFKDEVQKINGAEHDFLFGFYYRQMGNTKAAIERYESALNQRKSFARAQRDLVQVYLGIEDYEMAYKLAKENYSQDKKNNPFHIHAYFTTVIRKSNLTDREIILDKLIQELYMNKHEKAKEFYYRCKAQYEAFINNREAASLDFLEQAYTKYPNNYHILIDKYYICSRFKDVSKMKEIINQYSRQYEGKGSFHQNTIIKFKVLLYSLEGKQNQIPILMKNLQNYPEGALKKYIEKYCLARDFL